MKNEWKTYPFEEVIADVTGGNPKTLQSEFLEKGRYAVVDQGKELIAGFVDDESRLCHAPLPVIIFGDHTCVFKFIDFPFCLGADGVKVLRPKVAADPKYLFHFLQMLRLQQGGYDRHFKYLKRTEIKLPPLPEQRRIVAILDQANALRAKRRATLAKLEELPQAIFLEMFGDPVTNAKGWKIQKLGAVGSLDRGVSKHRPRNAPELLGGSYPLIQTGDVANCNGYIREYSSTYSELGLRQSKMWPAGTLCITIAANIAKTGILTFNACFPDSVVGFCAKNPATVELVRVWLSFIQKTLEESAPESAQKNINLAILRNLDMPLPPLSLQLEFAECIRAVEEVKVSQRVHLSKLENLFAFLQHRAFQGEL